MHHFFMGYVIFSWDAPFFHGIYDLFTGRVTHQAGRAIHLVGRAIF
jgi:hypothetical protein